MTIVLPEQPMAVVPALPYFGSNGTLSMLLVPTVGDKGFLELLSFKSRGVIRTSETGGHMMPVVFTNPGVNNKIVCYDSLKDGPTFENFNEATELISCNIFTSTSQIPKSLLITWSEREVPRYIFNI
jgi:hypothetical protein